MVVWNGLSRLELSIGWGCVSVCRIDLLFTSFLFDWILDLVRESAEYLLSGRVGEWRAPFTFFSLFSSVCSMTVYRRSDWVSLLDRCVVNLRRFSLR